MSEKYVDFEKSGVKRVDVRAVRMKTINGDDMIVAATRCIPDDNDKPLPGGLFQIMLRQQLITESIKELVEKDGTIVKPTPARIQKLSKRTVEYIGDIYDFLNGVTRAEQEDFQKALENESPTSTSAASAHVVDEITLER